MDAEGIDPDPGPVMAGAALGRPLSVAGLADLDGRYDVILMNHTLEHVHAPVAFLAAAAGRLAPGGALLVNVPNHRSPVAAVMRDQWIGWLPTEHVFHYSRSTLADVAAQGGLRIAESSTTGVIEPPSAGVKGVVKRAVTIAARRAGRGDELECVLRHAR
jgi:SAM-dependent methyltransferase